MEFRMPEFGEYPFAVGTRFCHHHDNQVGVTGGTQKQVRECVSYRKALEQSESDSASGHLEFGDHALGEFCRHSISKHLDTMTTHPSAQS